MTTECATGIVQGILQRQIVSLSIISTLPLSIISALPLSIISALTRHVSLSIDKCVDKTIDKSRLSTFEGVLVIVLVLI
jgi:hypothetical protein